MAAGGYQDPQEAAQCLQSLPVLEPRTEGAKRDMVLPVIPVLAFGECQGLCGLSEGDARHPDTPQRCYTAASLAGTWLLVQSEAAAGEYHEEVDGEFGHIPAPSPQHHGTKLTPAWRWGLKASPGPPRGLVSVRQHLCPCAGAPTISIFLKPPGVIPPGGSTTICCSCQCDQGKVVLYKDGKQLCTQELRDGRAEFPISNATRKDAGPYSCHYLAGGTVLARSETLEITVKGEGCAVTPSRAVRL